MYIMVKMLMDGHGAALHALPLNFDGRERL